MRGETENFCLDIVKKSMFRDYKYFPFREKQAKYFYDMSFDEFKKNINEWTSLDVNEKYFGLLENDRIEIPNIIRTAKANPDPSKFPDFKFENGFIEHFQITSSKTTRKGSKQGKFVGDTERAVSKQQEEWLKDDDFIGSRTESWNIEKAEHKYEYLKESFKNNWESHIESLKKYDGPKDIGIFMIEYPDIVLKMCERMYSGWISGMSQGDMRRQERQRCYRISRDKDLLNYIYAYREQIKYVIYVYQDKFEIIKTENIPYILELLPFEFDIYPLNVQTFSCLTNVRMPININREGEKND